MILVESEIEKMTVTVEIDENGDHRKWSGSPELICEGHVCLFEAVDILTVVKAVKTAETVENSEISQEAEDSVIEPSIQNSEVKISEDMALDTL